MSPFSARLVTALALSALAGTVAALPPEGNSRGRMLYENHCGACHSSEVHWRDKKLARDWDGLLLQVRMWQDNGKLNWNEADIRDVAQHLNATYYHLPSAAD